LLAPPVTPAVRPVAAYMADRSRYLRAVQRRRLLGLMLTLMGVLLMAIFSYVLLAFVYRTGPFSHRRYHDNEINRRASVKGFCRVRLPRGLGEIRESFSVSPRVIFVKMGSRGQSMTIVDLKRTFIRKDRNCYVKTMEAHFFQPRNPEQGEIMSHGERVEANLQMTTMIISDARYTEPIFERAYGREAAHFCARTRIFHLERANPGLVDAIPRTREVGRFADEPRHMNSGVLKRQRKSVAPKDNCQKYDQVFEGMDPTDPKHVVTVLNVFKCPHLV